MANQASFAALSVSSWKRHIVPLSGDPVLPPKGIRVSITCSGRRSGWSWLSRDLGLSSLLYDKFEQGKLEFARQYLQPVNTVMDIGANIGLFALAMGRTIRHNGRVTAFDPVQMNIAKLKSN